MTDDHCYLRDQTLVCSRCGYSVPIELPISVQGLADKAKAFVKGHQRCLLPNAYEQMVRDD